MLQCPHDVLAEALHHALAGIGDQADLAALAESLADAPDAVVRPGSHDDVAAVLAVAAVSPAGPGAVPADPLAGPVLLLAADVLGRVVPPPGEVQAGVVTAVVGAPLFVALVRRRRFLR